MSEVTLTGEQLIQAVRILWNYNQFRSTRQRGQPHDQDYDYKLVCDEDDIHEYLVEAGLLVQDNESDSDDQDSYQWLSNESIDTLRYVTIEPVVK